MFPTQQKFRLVHLEFWDHVSGPGDDADPIKCEVVGILYKESKLSYYVASWICDEDLKNPNTEVYCILKSTVTKKKVIK